jgi:hypothetical protein
MENFGMSTTPCSLDSQCYPYQCDLTTHSCAIPRQAQDVALLQCVIGSLDNYQLQWYASQYHQSFASTSPDVISIAQSIYATVDCVAADQGTYF